LPYSSGVKQESRVGRWRIDNIEAPLKSELKRTNTPIVRDATSWAGLCANRNVDEQPVCRIFAGVQYTIVDNLPASLTCAERDLASVVGRSVDLSRCIADHGAAIEVAGIVIDAVAANPDNTVHIVSPSLGINQTVTVTITDRRRAVAGRIHVDGYLVDGGSRVSGLRRHGHRQQRAGGKQTNGRKE
jgi:hypothetical protein